MELSQREREVVCLVAKGQSNREIADRLYLSEKTVKFHLKSVFRKQEILSRGELKEALRKPPL